MTDGVDAYFEDHRESTDLGRRALRGGIVSVATQYGNGILQIVAAIVLARLLTPADFGLVAIITVLTSFAPLLIDFGLGDATTQRSKITPSQISSLFWLGVGVATAVAVVVAACSPLIAAIYRQPALQPIALCTSISFVLWGISNQHLALLRRTMQFGRIARIQLLGTLAGIVVAIVLAVAGFGYWALVARPIANALCVAAGAWLGCPWRPGPPAFDGEVKSMVRFGVHVVGFSVTYTVAKAVDRIGLGLFYRPEQVGYYQNAITLYESSIFQVFAQVHTVGSAALSKLQSNTNALRQKYAAALSALAFFVMPAAAILSVTGEDVAVILLGKKWQAAGLLPGHRDVAGVAAPFDRPGGPLAKLGGRLARRADCGGSGRPAVRGDRGRRRERHREHAHRAPFGRLCRPADRDPLRAGAARRGTAADRRSQCRCRRLVAADGPSGALVHSRTHHRVGERVRLHLPHHRRRLVSRHGAHQGRTHGGAGSTPQPQEHLKLTGAHARDTSQSFALGFRFCRNPIPLIVVARALARALIQYECRGGALG